MKKKVFFGIVSIVLLYLVWAAGSVGLGCSINQKLLSVAQKKSGLRAAIRRVNENNNE